MPHPSPHPYQRGLSRRHGAQGALRTRTPGAGLSGETVYSQGLTSPGAEARWFTQHLLSAYCVPGPTTPWEAGPASPPPGPTRCFSPGAPRGAPGGRAGRRCRAPRGHRCSPPPPPGRPEQTRGTDHPQGGPAPGAGRAGRRCWAPPRPQGLQSRSLVDADGEPPRASHTTQRERKPHSRESLSTTLAAAATGHKPGTCPRTRHCSAREGAPGTGAARASVGRVTPHSRGATSLAPRSDSGAEQGPGGEAGDGPQGPG